MHILIISVVMCLLHWSAITHTMVPGDIGMKAEFNDFVKMFNRTYKSLNEQETRFNIFKENLREAAERNRKIGEDIYGITKFSDWTAEEFNVMMGTKPDLMSPTPSCETIHAPSGSAPNSLDYVALGKVSPVKNQGTCGSCWAFSATGQLESQVLIKHNQKISLSEQQLVDCDKKSNGCVEGSPVAALSYLISKGSQQDRDYPYEGVERQCRYDPSKVKVKVTACNLYRIQSENQLKSLLKEVGPVVILVASSEWKSYKGGIMKDCISEKVDHGVLLVGYGTEGGVDYWIVKNSWGGNWGERGYIRLHRSTNQCQMAIHPPIGGTVA